MGRASIRKVKAPNMYGDIVQQYSVGVGDIRHIVPTRYEAKEWLEKFKIANKSHYRRRR